MNGSRILIAGAGIGGLVAALALVQRGFEVALYEQAAELHEVGAGLQIAPNGSRVLRAIGLEQALQTMVSVAASREMRLFSTGQSWPMPNAATAIARFGSPIWFVHRGDLHRALVSALAQHAPGAVHVGSRCIGLEQDARGVTLSLENGDRVRGDALIGADGVHSCVRETLYGGGRAAFTGFVAWRAVVSMARLPLRLRQQGLAGWAGSHGHVMTYPLRGGELLNFVAVVARDDWQVESWSEAGTVEECRRDFAGWHDDVLAVIDAVDVPYKWALIGRQPLEHWSVGSVGLLGDACHPMLPFLGQGANMAIEDGMVLARCLEASADIPEALRRYEAARFARISRIVAESRANAERVHNPLLADAEQAKAFMDREFAPGALGARYDWLYEYDAMSVPI